MKKSQIIQSVIFIALLVMIFFGVHSVIEAKQAVGLCMEPHIDNVSLFMVVKAAYWFDDPARGDVIVFRPPPAADSPDNFVKRIIGLPGEKIECKGGVVYIDGKPLAEPYVQGTTLDFAAIEVPEGCYFVMGDNRQHSDDSRYWGCLPRENIIGRAYLVYWPLKDWYLLRGYSYSTN